MVPPEADAVLQEADAVPPEADVAVPVEAHRQSSNHTDIPVFSSPKAKNIFLSPKISFPANQSTAKNVYLSKDQSRALRRSTVSGIPSGASLQLVSSVVSTKFSSHQERRCSTSVLPLEPVSATSQTLSDLYVAPITHLPFFSNYS